MSNPIGSAKHRPTHITRKNGRRGMPAFLLQPGLKIQRGDDEASESACLQQGPRRKIKRP